MSAADRRSARREVMNPILGLPAAKLALMELTPAEKERVRRVLLAIQTDARAKAEASWAKGKGPMAAYWRAAGVYCGHIARAIGRP